MKPDGHQSNRREGRVAVPAIGRDAQESPLANWQPRSAQAFTLIEFLGVLAIIAILAAVLMPVAIRQIDEAARTKERTDLVAISNAVVQQVLSAKIIPRESDLAQAAATWTRQPASRITTTPRGQSRAFLLDTNGWFGTTSLPYNQTNTGTFITNTARLMIVSTVGRALLVSTGRPADFNAIWDTVEGAIPSTWEGWQGRGEDLQIQRINLQPLFHRLIAVNREAGVPPPQLSIDTTNPIEILNAGTGLDAYYLDGSVVGLCNAPATLIRRFALIRDTGCVFDGAWRDDLGGGGGSNVEISQEFAALAAKFLAAEWYPGATQGGRSGTQQGALMAMFNFMLVYGLWADPFPHFNQHGANATLVPEYILLNDLVGSGQGNTASGFLNVFTGPGGLLN